MYGSEPWIRDMPPKDKVSPDDRELFRNSVGAVRPMEDDRVRLARPRQVSGPVARPRYEPPVDMMPESAAVCGPGPGERLSFARGGVQRRLLRRLERGQVPFQAELDLHGLVVADAARALARFIDECRDQGVRFARIVHGKGLGSPDALPVLKVQVDRWLKLRPEVLAFCSATPSDGGTGALYVLLRRDAGA